MPFVIFFALNLALAFFGDAGSTIELAHPLLEVMAACTLAWVEATLAWSALQLGRRVAWRLGIGDF